MTLITTDSQHYTDIASAIRSKAGVQDLFKPSQMASAIAAIPTGGGASLGSKTITDNGTYYAQADSLDGYSEVTVNVQGGGSSDELINIIVGGASGVASMQNVSLIRNYAFYNHRSLTGVYAPSVTSVGGDAFGNCSSLSFLDLPLCETIGYQAFTGCYSLVSISLPKCELISSNAFIWCSSIAELNLPKCSLISQTAFKGCRDLSVAILQECTTIYPSAFESCSSLMSLYMLASSVAVLSLSNAFRNTPLYASSYTGSFGSIFVPSSLYSDYIVANQWSYYSDRIASV